MANGRMLVLAAVVTVLLVISIAHTELSFAQSPAVSNWERGGYNDNNSRFNPQTQINQSNVQNLQLKWVYQIPHSPYTGTLSTLAGSKTTPLVINGTVYIGTQYDRIIAINAQNGNLEWSYQANLTALLASPSASGVTDVQHITSYNGLIYFQAADCTIYGIDALTGDVKFTIPDPCANIPGGQNYKYAGETPPVVYEKGGVLMLGEAGETTGRGFLAGYSATTGHLLWRWFVVPPQGGDPNWDSKDVVQLGNGTTVNYGQPKGNISPYAGDWGNSSRIVGGTNWALNLMDQDTGIAYVATSVPIGPDMKFFPGPNLFDSSLVALNATTGKIVWYYQIETHDIYSYGIGYQSGTLAQVQIGGKTVKAVLTDSKNGFAYGFNAQNGSLLWKQQISLQLNNANANAGNAANMTISQGDLVGKIVCPSTGGYAPQAFAYNTLYIAAQNNCGTPVLGTPNAVTGTPTYSFRAVGPTNSTIYALDGATGKVKWQYNTPNPYQGAALTVSGGVVYAIDRTGILYALEADNGKPLQTLNLGGQAGAGVTIGSDNAGNMMLFVTSGGGLTTGTVMALGLGNAPPPAPSTATTTTTVISTTTTTPAPSTTTMTNTEVELVVALVAVSAILVVSVVYRMRPKR